MELVVGEAPPPDGCGTGRGVGILLCKPRASLRIIRMCKTQDAGRYPLLHFLGSLAEAAVRLQRPEAKVRGGGDEGQGKEEAEDGDEEEGEEREEGSGEGQKVIVMT